MGLGVEGTFLDKLTEGGSNDRKLLEKRFGDKEKPDSREVSVHEQDWWEMKWQALFEFSENHKWEKVGLWKREESCVEFCTDGNMSW